MQTHLKYWGDADVDHSQTFGGIQPYYWGDISPHPPGFRHPWQRHFFKRSCVARRRNDAEKDPVNLLHASA